MSKTLLKIIVSSLLLFSCNNNEEKEGESATSGTPANALYEANGSAPEQGRDGGGEFPAIEGSRGLSNRNSYNLKLQADAFGRMFLLSSTLISAPPTPSSTSLANKIVFFKKRANKVFMFESLSGKLLTDTIVTDVLLAEFPVVSEQSDGVVEIDFQEGMRTLFVRPSYYINSGKSKGNSGETIWNVTNSYIRSIESRGKYTFIDQIARVNKVRKGHSLNLSAHIQYTLSPYSHNPDFSPVPSEEVDGAGYFAVHPVLKANGEDPTSPIMRFDISNDKKITYYLAGNIPEDFRKPIKEGILYWNKAFGSDVIQVEDLPDDVEIDDPSYNIVVWLNWPKKRFAYADFTTDPLSGEILRSRVYITSSMVLGSYKDAINMLYLYASMESEEEEEEEEEEEDSQPAERNLLDELQTLEEDDPSEDIPLQIRGFDRAANCYTSYNPNRFVGMARRLSMLSAESQEQPTNEQLLKRLIKRVAYDDIRSTMAHEIGHTLGLRHNFAASTETSLTPENYTRVIEEYLISGQTPTEQATSSVMDYLPTTVNTIVGGQIQNFHEALSYDESAIRYAYKYSGGKQMSFGAFCTDSGIRDIADCRRWDKFSNQIVGSAYTLNESSKEVAFKLAAKFGALAIKDDGFSDAYKKWKEKLRINAVPMNPQANATALAKYRYIPLTETIKDGARFTAVSKDHIKSSLFDEDLHNTKIETIEYVNESLEQFGGVGSYLLDSITPITTEPTEEALPEGQQVYADKTAKLIAGMQESFWKAVDALYPELSEEGKEVLRAKMKKYFMTFEKHYILAVIVILQETSPAIVDYSLPNVLNTIANDILFIKSGEVIPPAPHPPRVYQEKSIFPIGDIQVPKYHYDYGELNLRRELTSLLTHDFYPSFPSYKRQTEGLYDNLYQQHKYDIKNITQGSPDESLPHHVYDWIQWEKDIFRPLRPAS